MLNPGSTVGLRDRLRGVHDFLFARWYLDELIDFLIYRPVIAIGSFANNTFERLVVQGAVVGGATGAAKGLGGIVRNAESGFVRFYSLLVIAGIAGLGLYFLVAAS